MIDENKNKKKTMLMKYLERFTPNGIEDGQES